MSQKAKARSELRKNNIRKKALDFVLNDKHSRASEKSTQRLLEGIRQTKYTGVSKSNYTKKKIKEAKDSYDEDDDIPMEVVSGDPFSFLNRDTAIKVPDGERKNRFRDMTNAIKSGPQTDAASLNNGNLSTMSGWEAPNWTRQERKQAYTNGVDPSAISSIKGRTPQAYKRYCELMKAKYGQVSKKQFVMMMPTDVAQYYAAKSSKGKRGYKRKYKKARRMPARRRGRKGRSGYGDYSFGGGFGYDSSQGFRAFGDARFEGKESVLGGITGVGDYTVKCNSLMGNIDLGSSPPRVQNTSKGEAVILQHREFIGNLYTNHITTGLSTNFNMAYPGASTTPGATQLGQRINIGNSVLFPYASQLAINFQEYEMRGMIVELKSLCSNTATALSLGSMFGSTNYNVLNPAPINKIEVENMEYAVSAKPTESIILPIECAPSLNLASHYDVVIDGDYKGGDPRFCDLGTLFLGTEGCPTADAPIAEIWISYEVALFKPILQIQIGATEQFANARFQNTAFAGTTFPLANVQVSGNLPVTSTGFVLTLPNKNATYFIETDINSSAALPNIVLPTGSTGVLTSSGTQPLLMYNFAGNTNWVIQANSADAGLGTFCSQTTMIIQTVYIAGNTPTLTFGPVAGYTANSALNTNVIQIA